MRPFRRVTSKGSLRDLSISFVYQKWCSLVSTISSRVFTGSKLVIPRLWSHPVTYLHRLRLSKRRLHKAIPRSPNDRPNIQILCGASHTSTMPCHSRIPRASPGRRNRARRRRGGKQHHESRRELCDSVWAGRRMRGEVPEDESVRDGYNMGQTR